MAAVDIQIEGTSYIAGSAPGQYVVDFTSVSVDLDIVLQQPRASFDIIVWNKAIGRPKAGSDVVFLNSSGGREFGGILQIVEETEMQPTIMRYKCTCSDYTKWFDRHLVRGIYQSQLAGDLVRTIVSQYVNTPGNGRTFTTNNVQDGYPVPLQQFLYQPPSQVVGQLIQMLGWGFYIDEYRDVNFFALEQFTSPLPSNILNADDLYDDPSLSGAQYPNWVDLAISEDTSQLKNRCYVTGIFIASQILYTETKVGDGSTTQFVLGYQPPNDVTKITVSVGGTPYQIGLDQINSVPGGPCTDNVAYVNFTQQTVRFCTAPASGALVVINYYPMLQTAVMEENAQAQSFMKARDGTDGIYEYNRMDPSLSAELPSLAQQRAFMTLSKYAYPYLSVNFRSFLQGWRPGQHFYLSSNRRFGGELQNQQLYVLRVQKHLVQATEADGWLWEYTIDAASTPYEI